MCEAGWNGVIAFLSAWLAHQPPPVVIGVFLAVMFSLVMFVGGLRESFVPRSGMERRDRVVRTSGEKKTSSLKPRAPQIAGIASLQAAKRWVPKDRDRPLRRCGVLRPTIRRAPAFEVARRALPVRDPDASLA